LPSSIEEIEDRIDKIESIDKLKAELKLMWRIIYASYVKADKESSLKGLR